ncbi:hypothetical protein LTR66_014695 [Elasticomyces elasticus]|nr:hypothetical protein LTR66_014695 [Elasticomyces elasticus]KAK5006430.1 hypothetical protein LTR28_006501 [Elasticomyces elasticus]
MSFVLPVDTVDATNNQDEAMDAPVSTALIPANPANAAPLKQPLGPNLLGLLPRDVRDRIYKLLLIYDKRIEVTPLTTGPRIEPMALTCHQFRQEFCSHLSVFYAGNSFQIHSNDFFCGPARRWLRKVGEVNCALIESLLIDLNADHGQLVIERHELAMVSHCYPSSALRAHWRRQRRDHVSMWRRTYTACGLAHRSLTYDVSYTAPTIAVNQRICHPFVRVMREILPLRRGRRSEVKDVDAQEGTSVVLLRLRSL